MNTEQLGVIKNAADILGDNGYEILAEQVRYAYETLAEKEFGGSR